MLKQEIANLLIKKTRMRSKDILNLIETPPDSEMGDYSFPCFVLTKKEKKSPIEIAKIYANTLKPNKYIEKISALGPYLNFFINKSELTKRIIKINSNFGKTNLGKKRKIVIDFSSPNIGKPMHLGHIRSTIIGDSVLRTYDFLGYDVIGINFLGDVGLHIGKLIVAYELWVDNEKLKKDPVAELSRLYVKFCSKEETKITEGLEEEFQNNDWTNKAKDAVKKLELGNKKVVNIYNKIRKYSIVGFNEIYKLLKVDFHHTTGPSEFEKKGKEIVIEALKKGIAKREDDGAVYIEINDKKKFIQRSNQTASYITYDLGAAVERAKNYKFEKIIYTTDFRQIDHFRSLFSILKLLGYNFSDKMYHLPFGNIKYEGKIMAARSGEGLLLGDVLNKTISEANKEIKKRKRKGDAKIVGVGAIKYMILKNEPIKDVNFSWEQALSFEGNTGPYLQYSYARASSIIKKANKENFNKGNPKTNNITNEEFELIKKISKFPEVVRRSGRILDPSIIANYSFELCQIFNEFYHSNHVIGDSRESVRLRIIDSFRTCLKNALWLLGIEVMEEM